MGTAADRLREYRIQKCQNVQLIEKENAALRILASERYNRIQELETQVEYLRDENARLKRRT